MICRRCGVREGKERWYVPTPNASLAGTQMKVGVKKTIGCDECWEEFQHEVQANASSREQ